jgi:thiol:disulfide interchange protein DsbC
MKKIIAGVILAMVGVVSTASAGPVEVKIKNAVSPLLQGAAVEKVEYSQRLSVYEVITDRGVFYTDKKGSYVIFGPAIDTKTKKDLTAERMDKLGAFEFDKLPFQDAIKTVKGDGSRKLVTLEDPNCGFCKKLMQELVKLDNVTIYTFMTPILSKDSAEKSAAVWCSPEQSKTWSELMLNGQPPAHVKQCENPIARNLALKSKLRIMGTPALLFENNVKVPGYITSDKIEENLKKATLEKK